jgi:RNA polymerase sigma factor (sigma-70 family)
LVATQRWNSAAMSKTSSPSIPRRGQLDARYQDNRDYVLGVLAWRCRWVDPADREAIFHDAFIVLLEKERDGALEPGLLHPSQVRAYLTRTALHKALDERKSARFRLSAPLESDASEVVELVAPDPSVEDRVVLRSESARLRGIMSQLPQRRQRVLQLRFCLNHSPEEIQAHLGISERVYRRELERGRRTVQEHFCAAEAASA